MINLLLLILFIFATQYGWRFSQSKAIKLSEAEMLSAGRMEEVVNDIAGGIGNRNYLSYEQLNTTADYIAKQFKGLGYEVDEHTFGANGQTFRNIVAEIPGKTQEVLIIGAHYDSCFNPGANDNASGVAGLIEMARLLKDAHLKTKIRFVAFTNEEPPFFQTDQMGSTVYARLLKSKNEKIRGAIVFEMIGYYSDRINSQRYLPFLGPFYPNKANFIAIVGNFQSKTFVNELTLNFKDNSEFPISSIVAPDFIPGLNYSDHWSFWREGYPAVMVTDTAYMRYKHYHKSSDLPEHLDYQKMAQVIHGLSKAIISSALAG